MEEKGTPQNMGFENRDSGLYNQANFLRKTMNFRKMYFLIFKSCCKTLCFHFAQIIESFPKRARMGKLKKK